MTHRLTFVIFSMLIAASVVQFHIKNTKKIHQRKKILQNCKYTQNRRVEQKLNQELMPICAVVQFKCPTKEDSHCYYVRS